MKHIVKQNEPTSLQEHRVAFNASYGNLSTDTREDLQGTLLENQGHICAYCMQRISTDWNSTLSKRKIEIEHYRSQHRYPNLTLTWKNMLGVCNGNARKAKHKLICDKAKSAYDKTNDLMIDPQDKLRIEQLKYSKDGQVFSGIEAIDFDLNTILNLNEENLKKRRANLYRNLKKKIRSFWARTQRNKTKVKQLLEKELAFWKSRYKNKQFIELSGLALYILEKELKKF